MEKVKLSCSAIEMKVQIVLSEVEARALLKMTQYGTDPYLKWFEKNLSRYELDGLKHGVRSLFDTVRKEIPIHIQKVDEARKLISK